MDGRMDGLMIRMDGCMHESADTWVDDVDNADNDNDDADNDDENDDEDENTGNNGGVDNEAEMKEARKEVEKIQAAIEAMKIEKVRTRKGEERKFRGNEKFGEKS